MGMSSPVVLNLVRYQCAWFATVLGAAGSHEWLGDLIAVFMIGLHIRQAPSPRTEIRTILAILLIGALWEFGVVQLKIVAYRFSYAIIGVPVWILLLWAAFATTLNGCLGWLRERLLLASLLGGILGPLSWYGGAKLNALTVPAGLSGYLFLGFGWLFLMPVLSRLALYFDKAEGLRRGV